MPDVTCVDGSVLTVLAVPVLDRDGAPYEMTLRLLRDGVPFGEVGERCGWFLTGAIERLRADGQVPESTLEHGVRAAGADWAQLAPHLPRDRELFAFLAREPDDLPGAGELRVRLRTVRTWSGRGWQVRHDALLEAWGDGGTGVRAVLDRQALLALLEPLAPGAHGSGAAASSAGNDSSAVGQEQRARAASPDRLAARG